LPRWKLHDDGSFDLTVGGLSLSQCYPAIDGHSVFAKSVSVKQDGKAGSITYKLDNAVLILAFGYDSDSAILRTTLKGLGKTPDWIYPVAQAEIKGADRFYKQGVGFAGPSGVIKIKSPVIRRESPTPDEAWSLDSYMTSGLLAPDNTTIAVGAYEHNNYLQRSTLYNRQYRFGLIDRWLDTDACYYEAGFAAENIPVPDKTLNLPDLHFIAGTDPFAAFQHLAKNIAKASKARLDKPTSYHWCSWYDCEKEFSIQKLEEFLAGLKQIDPPTPIMAVQIDDYCNYGDWLLENDKWPGTLKPAFEKIIQAGYRPGIWVGPFMVDSRSHIYKEHPDWLLRDANGVPIIHWKREGYNVLQLDSSCPEAFEYLRTVFRTLRSWGATYYKTDFMDWGLQDSTKVKRYTPGKTSVQYFVDVAKMIREEIGDDSFWLGCISPYAPMIGRVDAIRVANDVAYAWSPGGVGNMFQESFADQYFNSILWQNDPDVLYVRTYNCQLTEDEAYSIALWDAILGGVVNTSDMFHKVPPDRLKLWRFVQPTKEHRIAQLPFWSKPYTEQRTLAAVRPYPDRSAWSVLFVNPSDLPIAETCPIKDLISRPDAFCFEWKPGQNKPMGRLPALILDLKPHASALYYLSQNDAPPPADMTISGMTVLGLNESLTTRGEKIVNRQANSSSK
jgi:hypothetical protein